jgi:nuclear GTP-binding protein
LTGTGRSKATIQRLNMYKGGKPVRNVDGKIVGGTLMMSDTAGGQTVGPVVRIAPDRRWFGNTRTISQGELDRFRDEMTTQSADPYSVILKRNKIPMALLNDAKSISSMNLLKTESFDAAFGTKQTRKRPKLHHTLSDYAEMAQHTQEKSQEYIANPRSDINNEIQETGELEARKEDVFAKGQSKRIWAELYKVLDCSDVVLQVRKNMLSFKNNSGVNN